jgi:8-oxo-dGTP diphosphatase
VEPIVDVALVLPLARGRVLVARRQEGTHLAGLWEFPGGKLARGEAPEAAARRELAEETGLVALELEPLVVLEHEYPERAVRLHAFLAPEPQGVVRIEGPREWAWKTPAELGGLDLPPANGPILEALRRRLL